MTLTIELAEWLVSAQAESWLQQASAALSAGETPLRTLTSLRKVLSVAEASAVVEQATLRRAGQIKFSRAAEMWFTVKSLEQATGECLARYKAGRFAYGEAVVDLCCGLGGDGVALAERAPCHLVDRDPVLVCFAAANCRRYESALVSSEVADVGTLDPRAWSAVHIDPDRRSRGGRTTTLSQFEPHVGELARWIEACPSVALKLAPATQLPADWAQQSERQWLGFDRECKQQVAWFGGMAQHPGRRSVAIVSRAGATQEFVEDVSGDRANVSPPRVVAVAGDYLVEPHAAVRAAQLDVAFAARFGLARLGDATRFWTASQPLPEGLARSFQIVADYAPQAREVAKLLARLAAAKPEIKAPGAPESLVKPLSRLPAHGSQPVTLVVTRIQDRWRCVVAQPVPS